MAKFGKLDFSTSFKPTSAFPLDARTYFESYTTAVAAAATAAVVGSSDSVYYIGQTLTVVENGIVKDYKIQADRTLKEVGSNVQVQVDTATAEEIGDFFDSFETGTVASQSDIVDSLG